MEYILVGFVVCFFTPYRVSQLLFFSPVLHSRELTIGLARCIRVIYFSCLDLRLSPRAKHYNHQRICCSAS